MDSEIFKIQYGLSIIDCKFVHKKSNDLKFEFCSLLDLLIIKSCQI